MMIQFCEFCSTVVKEETDRCPSCGCRMAQSVDEETFNNPENPWPFARVMDITLRIMGQPRHIHFDGTHSLYHLWRGMSGYYRDQALWYRIRHDEVELVSFPKGRQLEDFQILEPGDILNCTNTRFSCYGHDLPDRELGLDADAMVKTYQGTFDILDCPEKDIPFVLGWLLSNGPEDRCLEGWVYDI